MKRLLALASIALGTLCLAPSAQAQAKPPEPRCDASTTLASFHVSSIKPEFKANKEACTSLNAVIKRLFSTTKAGGRKLENDKPLDVAAAEAERKKALADHDYVDMLKPLLADETDPVRRLLLEAAVLDDFGYYQARDLLLQQIATRLGIAP
jgi:hypothetical protein